MATRFEASAGLPTHAKAGCCVSPWHRHRGASAFSCGLLAAVLGASCTPGTQPPPDEEKTYAWAKVAETPGSALTAISGTSANNVYAVGADDTTGPIVLHWDGSDWTRLQTGVRGDLWWVFAVDDVVFMSGANSNILKYDGEFERMSTPGLGKYVVYGIWGSSATNVYAVGAVTGRNGFIWHYDGTAWTALDAPGGLPQDDNHDIPQFLKVWGTAADDVWVVGQNGVLLRGNAADGFQVVPTDSDSLLFTVHGIANRVVAVGVETDGVLLDVESGVTQVSVPGSQLLQGVWIMPNGKLWTCGAQGDIYRETSNGLVKQDTGFEGAVQSLHAVWVDEDEGVWAVGGSVLSPPLANGELIYGHPTKAAPTAVRIESPTATVDTSCPAAAIDPEPTRSIARRWNEQLLNSIRRDTPRPTVHARNLFHFSAAVWDAWAAYDDTATGYLVREKLTADDVQAAREEAISYAAYRLLSHRYSAAVGGAVSTSCYSSFMDVLGYDVNNTSTEGDSPAALGNRIGQAYIDGYANDGSNEANNYADPDAYSPTEPKLTVDQVGSNTTDPTKWQQLILAEAVTQNGIPEGSGVQGYIGAHWRDVTPFAITRPAEGGLYFDVPAPTTLDDELVEATVELVVKSSGMDPNDDTMIDISPGAIGNNPLGTNDGTGYDVNPATGLPYEPELVRLGDFSRVLAEFWADGPASETPPGHWNTVANDVADSAGFERRLFGTGDELDALSWDVHMYFALNGAVHDAAIAAWEQKREFLTARPITLIRTLGALGQRTNPDGPSYNPNGLPLVDDVIEVITDESSAPGQRHAHLRRYIGEVAVRSWRGEPGDRKGEVSGVGWLRATEWIPYQRRTFVTPAFPGFVSGHSTFSRSAAEVITEITGSAYFPGGIGGYSFDPGWLTFEKGPSASIELRWATYYDAADQAGQSRLWGGIHVRQDDFNGRIMGSQIGAQAIELANEYFTGTISEE